MSETFESIKDIQWKSIGASFLIVDSPKTGRQPFHFLFNALLKEITHKITNQYVYSENIIYRLPDGDYSKIPEIGESIAIEFLFTGGALELADLWRNLLVDFFNGENSFHSLRLAGCDAPQSFLFSDIWAETTIDIKTATYLELDFLSFYETGVTDKELPQTYMDSSVFAKHLRARIKNMSGVEVPRVCEELFDIDYGNWHFSLTPKNSVSQKGSTHYIGGCTGSLMVSGDLSEILPYVVLCSHIGTGGMKAFAQGHFTMASYHQAESPNPYKKTLYVTVPYSCVGVSGGCITVRKDGEQVTEIPVIRVSEVIIDGASSISSEFIDSMLSESIPVAVVTDSGTTLLGAFGSGHYETSAKHFMRYSILTEAEKLACAANLITVKIGTYLEQVRRRSLPTAIKHKANKAIATVSSASEIDIIRGAEGAFASEVFACYKTMIKNPAFAFDKRGRAEQDKFNSLTNYASHLIFSRIKGALMAAGLNPYLGFVHSEKNRYESLAADIQELYRAETERIVLTMINRGVVNESSFRRADSGRYFLTHSGRQLFLNSFEKMFLDDRSGMSVSESISANISLLKEWVLTGDFYGFRR